MLMEGIGMPKSSANFLAVCSISSTMRPIFTRLLLSIFSIVVTPFAVRLFLVVLEQLDQYFQLRERIDISITSAGVLALLDERHAFAFELQNRLLHAVDDEGDVMRA